MGNNTWRPRSPQLHQEWGAPQEAQQQEIRGQQQGYNQWLQNAMMGRGPSVAQVQQQAGLAAAQRAAASQAASARGGDVALSNRMAAQGQVNAASQASAEASQLRAQEQMGYAKQYGEQLDTQRMADLKARGLSDEEAIAQLNAETAQNRTVADITEGNAGREQKSAGGIVTAIGGLLSDIASKEDVQTADDVRRQRLSDQLASAMYEKNSAPAGGGGGGLDLSGMLSDASSKSQIAKLRADNQNLKNALDAAFPEKHPVTMPVDYHVAAMTPEERASELPRAHGDTYQAEQYAAQMARARMNQQNAVSPPQAEPNPAAPQYQVDIGDAQLDQPTLTMASDFTSKEAYGPIDAVSYRYRPEAAARMTAESPARTPEEKAFVYADKRTPRAGIIAQQLEKSPEFRSSVVDTPAGKAVVRDRALSTALAQGADLDKRLRALEAQRGAARSQ